jgi:hypothetical protein
MAGAIAAANRTSAEGRLSPPREGYSIGASSTDAAKAVRHGAK